MDEFIYGGIVGSVQTIIGHPLDTIKVLNQNKQNINFNFKRLYSGITFPLISSVINHSFMFYLNDYFLIEDNHFKSGFVTGILCTPIINTFDILKIKYQTNYDNINIKKIMLNSEKGFIATLLRESVGCSLYFGSYNYLKDKNYNPFLSGSTAGTVSWLFTYPIDVVKTRIQSGLVNNWSDAIKKGNLFKGLPVCLTRSFIVNGFAFSAYDYLKKL